MVKSFAKEEKTNYVDLALKSFDRNRIWPSDLVPMWRIAKLTLKVNVSNWLHKLVKEVERKLQSRLLRY